MANFIYAVLMNDDLIRRRMLSPKLYASPFFVDCIKNLQKAPSRITFIVKKNKRAIQTAF